MGFVLRLWISRLLGAEALGVMELASGVHMLALTPAAAGLPQAVSRLTAKARDRREREAVLYAGRRLALTLGLALTPIYLILPPFLAKWMGDERALPALTALAASEETPYLDYIELRSAIEALGGEAPEREFDALDPAYEALREKQ